MSTNAIDLSEALSALEPLEPDQYFVALGTGGRQFCGTPNGYCADRVPPRVCQDLLSGKIKRVLWASFGSEPNSFHFSYEMKDGNRAYRSGDGIPSCLKLFIQHVSRFSVQMASILRVQLGDNGSYVAWSGTYITFN